MLARSIHLAVLAAAAVLLFNGPAAAQVDTFVFNGHTYRLYGSADARTWPNAVTFATGQNVGGQAGYLAHVDDSAENTRIFQSIMANQASLTNTSPDGGGGRYAWIGGNDITAEGTWRWQDNNANFWTGGPTGSAVGGLYNNWGFTTARNEPDNFTTGSNPSGQDAAGISVNGWPLGVAGQWNDIADTNTMPFVVEFNVPEPGAMGGVVIVGLWAGLRRRRGAA